MAEKDREKQALERMVGANSDKLRIAHQGLVDIHMMVDAQVAATVIGHEFKVRAMSCKEDHLTRADLGG
jgi:hypothetical protein